MVKKYCEINNNITFVSEVFKKLALSLLARASENVHKINPY